MNNWSQTEAVGFIRLTCANELQRALDDRYTVQQWSVMTMEEALEAIAQIVVQPSNQAAEKGLFYSLKQGTYESISAFFTRAHKVAANCDFKCPSCDNGLGEYLLISKLAVGLSDPTLRKEVFRSYEVFKSVNALRSYCMAYETATKSSEPVRGAFHSVPGDAAAAAAAALCNERENTDDGDAMVAGALHKANLLRKNMGSPASN